MPAGVARGKQRRCQLVGHRRARGLLFGLGCQAACLRPELGQDVVDPGEVRLGLRQLVLGLAPASLVAADTGDLLEQRAPLLGPQGKGLVDHALADEQERVVGEVRRVEEVDQIAQADALLVEQVFVLATAIQAPAELEDLIVDGQQAVSVVQHQGDVGHALGGALLRSRPDDIFRLARAERASLLAERPAERVRQVALARAVRSDDRADAAAELDLGPLRERLEPLDTQREEARRCVALLDHAGRR